MSSGYYALQNTVFQPRDMLIISITNANPAVVTTSFDGVNPGNNNYVTGTIVRLNIPIAFGMQQANQQFAPITVITSSTFSIALDTTLFDTFAVPSPLPPHLVSFAQATPIGEVNGILTAAVQNVLPL